MEYKFVDSKTVTVITPTVGQKSLLKAVQSVSTQTYGSVRHLIVLDGMEYFEKLRDLKIEQTKNIVFSTTPENTGKVGDGFYGHRIYAAYAHLVNSDYVAFLDEDNWYEPNHLITLIETLEKENLDFAFSLRNIRNVDESFVIEDKCESLGMWPVFFSLDKPKTEQQYLVDTSTYLFRKDWLIKNSQHWHWGWGGDRHFFGEVREKSKYNTTGLHTLNYRLDDHVNKKYGSIDFFENGNEVVLNHYGEYPWIKKT